MHDKPAIRVGVIGYGFMGRIHALAYQNAQDAGYPCKVVAIADPTLQSLKQTDVPTGNISSGEREFEVSGVNLLHDARELIERSDIDLVSICTHTDSHVDLAMKALAAGKHVLVEKPVAICTEDVRKLALAADQSKCICIPAMCMRFWPAWVRIKEIIDSKKYGAVRSAVFHRLGTRPDWASDFYSDESRSGGMLHDLHIHDTDFIVHCFGMPRSVTTSGDGMHLSTIYQFADGPVHVLAHAAWDHQPAFGYQMRCTIVCERATLDFDFSRDHQLHIHQADTSKPMEVGDLTGYDGEIRFMLDCITGHSNLPIATMQSALHVAQVLEAEHRSLTSGVMVAI